MEVLVKMFSRILFFVLMHTGIDQAAFVATAVACSTTCARVSVTSRILSRGIWQRGVVPSVKIGIQRASMATVTFTVEQQKKVQSFGMRYVFAVVGSCMVSICMSKKVHTSGFSPNLTPSGIPDFFRKILATCEIHSNEPNRFQKKTTVAVPQKVEEAMCKEEIDFRSAIKACDWMKLSHSFVNAAMKKIPRERHGALYQLVVQQAWFWNRSDWTIWILFKGLDKEHTQGICRHALALSEIPQDLNEPLSDDFLKKRKKTLKDYI